MRKNVLNQRPIHCLKKLLWIWIGRPLKLYLNVWCSKGEGLCKQATWSWKLFQNVGALINTIIQRINSRHSRRCLDELLIDLHQIMIHFVFCGLQASKCIMRFPAKHLLSLRLETFKASYLNALLMSSISCLATQGKKTAIWILFRLNLLFRTRHSEASEQDHVNKQQCQC